MFDLVALRFIGVFYPDCEVSNTTVLAEVPRTGIAENDDLKKVVFKVTGRQILKPGWREIYTGSNSPDQNSPNPLK